MHATPDRAVDAIEHIHCKAFEFDTASRRTSATRRHGTENGLNAPPDTSIFFNRPSYDGGDTRIDWVTQEIAKATDSLFNFAKRRLRNDALSEDAVHDTILAALEGMDRFEAQSSVKTWLIGILKHKISDCERRTAREILMPMEFADFCLTDPDEIAGSSNDLEQAETVTPERTFESRELLGVCEQVLAKLPPTMREVFVLRVVHELSTDETCRELGITPANLWVLQHRARSRLREDLAAYGIETSAGKHSPSAGHAD